MGGRFSRKRTEGYADPYYDPLYQPPLGYGGPPGGYGGPPGGYGGSLGGYGRPPNRYGGYGGPPSPYGYQRGGGYPGGGYDEYDPYDDYGYGYGMTEPFGTYGPPRSGRYGRGKFFNFNGKICEKIYM
jgi:hypothetical protein